ncbi:hypothetical protein AX17_000594 [Amanita inopinata Kibby_2008]|nr:hypothetical protein AX17_000594 [Amanita inopinata Kibby_2008]
MAVPLMCFIDWFNRPDFEKRARDILRREDMIDIANYYSKSTASGLWILEYDRRFVGLIALDASSDNEPQAIEASVRHFYVEEPYRCSGIQDDLLAHSIHHTFKAGTNVQKIIVEDNPLLSYTGKALRSAGFVQGRSGTGKLGLFKWQLDEVVLDRVRWSQALANQQGAIPAGNLNVFIDAIDALLQDAGSPSETYKFLRELLSLLQERPDPSRLVLHVHQSAELVSLLTQASFSSSLVHLTAHPPALLVHLATEYLTPPPPSSSETKFWNVFLPISDRLYESSELIYSPSGEGSGSPFEVVVEILVRGIDGSSRRRGVHRVLEGYFITRRESCELAALESLKFVWRRTVDSVTPDPTLDVSFNLKLTSSQQDLRAQVPLPYEHKGKIKQSTAATILYDPDSADDIDDDDPDEDLDI